MTEKLQVGASEMIRVAGEHSAMKRTATQAEVANTAAFLLSDYGLHVSGEVIFVDGGYHVMGMPKLDNIEKA